MSDELARGLERILAPVLGEVEVTDLQRLTGGASRTTWAFSTSSADAPALILRTGPPDDVHASMELEAAVQQRAAAAGAPVPRIVAADNSAAALGNPYLICAAVAGETIVRRIYRGLDEQGRDLGGRGALGPCGAFADIDEAEGHIGRGLAADLGKQRRFLGAGHKERIGALGLALEFFDLGTAQMAGEVQGAFFGPAGLG